MSRFIDFRDFTSAKQHFEGNPGLCWLFKFLAVETWKRLEFTYIKPRLRVLETTITQNIAFTIHAYKSAFPGLGIEIWESTDEKAKGNDLELLLRFSRFGFMFYAPVQAKKIYRDGFYHGIKDDDQIEKLIDYAQRRNAYPMYLFYNYQDVIPVNIGPEDELYGCSLVSAYYLRNNHYQQKRKRAYNGRPARMGWALPDFSALHPNNAIPWHHLVCDIDHPLTLLQRLSLASREVSHFPTLPIATLDVERNWREINGFVALNSLNFDGWVQASDKDFFINQSDDYFRRVSRNEASEKDTAFRPQTRIIVDL